jgi:hypothetical protein
MCIHADGVDEVSVRYCDTAGHELPRLQLQTNMRMKPFKADE